MILCDLRKTNQSGFKLILKQIKRKNGLWLVAGEPVAGDLLDGVRGASAGAVCRSNESVCHRRGKTTPPLLLSCGQRSAFHQVYAVVLMLVPFAMDCLRSNFYITTVL